MSKSETVTETAYVIRNQDNRYLTKKHQWRSGLNKSELFRAKERDVALNELIEVNSKDILARLELIECELDNQRQPVVEVLADDPPEAEHEIDGEEAKQEDNSKENQSPHLELVKTDDTGESMPA